MDYYRLSLPFSIASMILLVSVVSNALGPCPDSALQCEGHSDCRGKHLCIENNCMRLYTTDDNRVSRVERDEDKGLVLVDDKSTSGCPFEGPVEPESRVMAIENTARERLETTVETAPGSIYHVSATLLVVITSSPTSVQLPEEDKPKPAEEKKEVEGRFGTKIVSDYDD